RPECIQTLTPPPPTRSILLRQNEKSWQADCYHDKPGAGRTVECRVKKELSVQFKARRRNERHAGGCTARDLFRSCARDARRAGRSDFRGRGCSLKLLAKERQRSRFRNDQ